MRQQKYILVNKNNGNIELRFGYPFYHKDLLNKNETWRDCIGGGKWTINAEDMSIVLYDSSDDFGSPKKQDLKKAIQDFDDWEHLEWICQHIYKSEIHLNKVIRI